VIRVTRPSSPGGTRRGPAGQASPGTCTIAQLGGTYPHYPRRPADADVAEGLDSRREGERSGHERRAAAHDPGADGEAPAEAAYFYPENGLRTALFVFDLAGSDQLPPTVEPLFRNLNAAVTLTPVMNADDLQRGFELAGIAP